MGMRRGDRWSKAAGWMGLAVGLALAAGCSHGPRTGNSLSTGPASNQTAAAVSEAPSQLDTDAGGSFASELPTDQQTDSPTPAAPVTLGSSFNWADPNGYQFKISISFGQPGISDPVVGAGTGCAGSDAPPGTTNIPFTLTITNLLDRGSSLPLMNQDLVGLGPNPHPAGADTAIFETDGSSCGGSLYYVASQEQNANAVPAGGTVTLHGVIYAAATPIPDGAAMTFSGLGHDVIASIPLPVGS